jgi:hypothetical protein
LLEAIGAPRPDGLFLEGEVQRSWRPFCCGRPGLMRSISIPSLSHQMASLEGLNWQQGSCSLLIITRLQPYRAGARHAESPCCGRPKSAHSKRSGGASARSSTHSRRMHQLLQELWLRFQVSQKCTRCFVKRRPPHQIQSQSVTLIRLACRSLPCYDPIYRNCSA